MANKELTDKQKLFLDLLFDDEVQGDIQLAKKLAGYSDSTPVSVLLSALADEIYERTREYLAANAPKAAMSLAGVLKTPTTPGVQNALRAAEQLLDRAGHVKTEKVQVQTDGGGLFILPPKD